MLIRYFVENFLSFNDLSEFSMISGKGRVLSDHLVRSNSRRGINILKAAVIFGPNASGKSNIIKSIDFAQRLILKGTEAKEMISINKFRLDSKNIDKPSRFQFDIKCGDKYYSYGFLLNFNRIHEEWLFEINKSKEKQLFHRKTINENDVNIEFGKLPELTNSKEHQFLEFVAKGTRANQLFLTESIQRNIQYFANVYDWFRNTLTVIFPESKFQGLELYLEKEEDFKRNLIELLQKFDTGISDIECKEYHVDEDFKEIPFHLITNLKKVLNRKGQKVILSSSENRRYLLFKDEKDEKIKVSKLLTKHKIKASGELANFELNEESDGTQRIIDLLPALIKLRNSNNVFIIDELDRSLHPLLVRNFLKEFLKIPSNAYSQLIVTTHDTNLLDLKILRKDEFWFIEKNKEGESHLFSLEEFRPRYDKDIQKGYLLGRFGAIPMIKN